jgi:glucosamine--fructose-6-phosphate aminotransferase (isomerizing)
MCGIFGYVGPRKNAAELILKSLKSLEYRGYDSWGIVVQSTDKLFLDKHVGKISKATTSLPAANLGLGHTRWATHGGVTEANAHPHLSCQGELALVHNGIIENYQDLKKPLRGHKFRSQTDSEVIAHHLEDLSPKLGLREALRRVFKKVDGLNAFVVTSFGEEKLVAAKNGSPLVVGLGSGENFIASDGAAILPYTRKLVFLEDGQMVELTRNQALFFDVTTGRRIQPKVFQVDWSTEEASLGRYQHFMIKEILEQPRVIRNIAENYAKQVTSMAKLLSSAHGIFLIGCGTAAHAALTGEYLFSRVAGKHVNFSVGSEFNYLEHFLNSKSLVLALSQSGETIDVIEPVTSAKKIGVKIASLVNTLGSTLYRLSDAKILLGAGPERCVCATKSFTAKLAVLLMISYALGSKVKVAQELLLKTAQAIEVVTSPKYTAKIRRLAKKISQQEHIYIIGRGLNYPTALEAALKIKEVSYIHAEGFAGGELKHGVIALVERGTPCIVFAPNDETYGAMVSNAMELRARGGYIIGISPKDNEAFDVYLPVADLGDASPIINAVPAQLLAYYLATSLGKDPDKPRNLAKSVTVK